MTDQNSDLAWELLSSKVVFDKYTKLEERQYRQPDGEVRDYYIKVTRPAVGILALTAANQVILVEQFRPGPGRVLLELPGGYIDEGEDAVQAGARELLEETGYAGKVEFITECLEESNSNMVHHAVVATDCQLVAEQALETSEFARVRLLELDEFLKVVRSGQMTDIDLAYLGLDHLGLLK